jgi:hypothetical protein
MAEPHTVDEERAYIENLLNTRFNYYILFVSLLLVPIAGDNPLSHLARVCLLAFGACVSALMAYMVVRTKYLLDALLKEIADDQPYKRACAKVELDHPRFTRNANDLMVWLVLLITLFFFAGGALAVTSPDTLFNQRSGPVQRQP